MTTETKAFEPDASTAPVVVHAVTVTKLDAALEAAGPLARAYAAACGFEAAPGQVLLAPAADGRLACVLFGVEPDDSRRRDRFLPGKLAAQLPPGDYALGSGFSDPFLAALAFERSAYRFTRFRAGVAPRPRLAVPPGVDAAELARVAGAIAFGRDLINRPANDLSPDALEEEVRALGERHGAEVTVIAGEELGAGFPMIHAVGRAAVEGPRLADLVWGDPGAAKVTLVGKGVCFDTGGLDIKSDAAMLLMKKDMGGAAAALALASMIMDAGLPLRLRVLVPIVENVISAFAFRPGDVLRSRKGLTVEIGNTDAEGRLILADALALADEEAPQLLLDFATLTGAARVALGPEVPPFYTDDETLAAAISHHAAAVNDPLWRLPLYDPYDALLSGKIADLNNITGGSFAGSVTAALFLRRFVERTESWAHFDVYGWNPVAKPGRPEGGEVQAAHAVYDLLKARFAR